MDERINRVCVFCVGFVGSYWQFDFDGRNKGPVFFIFRSLFDPGLQNLALLVGQFFPGGSGWHAFVVVLLQKNSSDEFAGIGFAGLDSNMAGIQGR